MSPSLQAPWQLGDSTSGSRLPLSRKLSGAQERSQKVEFKTGMKLAWKAATSILIEELNLGPGKSVHLVGGPEKPLNCSQESTRVRIDLPPEVTETSSPFFALKIDPSL